MSIKGWRFFLDRVQRIAISANYGLYGSIQQHFSDSGISSIGDRQLSRRQDHNVRR